MKNKINKYLLFFSLLLIGCNKENKYDLVQDYCGAVVVDKEIQTIRSKNDYSYDNDNFYITYSGKYTVLKDSVYNTIILPKYYNYKLGDTLCSQKNDSITIIKNKNKKLMKLIDDQQFIIDHFKNKYW